MKYSFGLVAIFIIVMFFNCSKDDNGPTAPSNKDNYTYKTVKIGNQVWMAENLKVTNYRNGDAIPNVTDDSEWASLSTGAYCNYDNNEQNAATLGRLYNWYAVNDSRKIAPKGWHVPTDEEWKQLEMVLGMSQSEADKIGWRGTDEGGKLKETGTLHWKDPNIGATNESGFSALQAFFRFKNGDFSYRVSGSNEFTYFWSSTESDTSNAFYRYLINDQMIIGRDDGDKHFGFSIRCVKDNVGPE
jgi:uncharacterized protein (TIGR02145 family)